MSNPSPKFCPACGHKLLPGAKFCPECGEKLEVASAAAPAEPTAAVAKAAAEPAKSVEAAKPVEPAKPAEPAKPVEPAKPASKAAAPAATAASSAAPAAKQDSIKALLGGGSDHDDHDEDDGRLPHPGAHKSDDEDAPMPKRRRGIPTPVIALAAAGLVIVSMGGYLASNPERLAAFQCHVMGKADKCETEQMRLNKLKKQKAEEEQQLMVPVMGAFDLSYGPKEIGWITIVQKRYEESRDEFVQRVRDNGTDSRKLVETRFGDYQIGKSKSEDGRRTGSIAFVSLEDWKGKHTGEAAPSLIPDPPPPPLKPGETPPPPPPPPAKPPEGPITWWPQKVKTKDATGKETEVLQEIALPISVQGVPMLEKEQADGTGKRLTAEAIADLQKKLESAPKPKEGEEAKADPSTEVKTVAVSTWTYEVHLWAPGYYPRNILFYDDPLPPDLEKKKLEAEKWTLRKFKKQPDGKLVIDNASFDMLPEPRTIQTRYLRVLKELHCMRLSKEYQGKSEQGKKDDEDLIWEQNAFDRDRREIAVKNDGDAEFEKLKEQMVKDAQCEKAP